MYEIKMGPEQSNTKIDHAKDCKILQPREENKKK